MPNDKGNSSKTKESSSYGSVWKPTSNYEPVTYPTYSSSSKSKKEDNPSGKLNDPKSTSSGNSKGKS
ncbi:hypothetical protein [Wolbachia endosymbiont of Folsomia candida]|uniref:hypothetical protein n=1 Tax=Wolbachia endosymbiont of Folsomia candida TaxID=169402 RepID=UPI000A975827|nr:hypothetical protein [Wolbachia endosymbiont of Folsomia candida]APR98385.2 hypothetical protein ASM33_03800 [Wolbachia endosymbiont of Folsomia candida]